MTYPETLHWLFSQLPMFQRDGKAAYKANLDNTHTLDAHFGHPHRKFKTIHVAGTNGKGSVSHMLASVLHETGIKVGLYTSPHLIDFRERIRVNGQVIPQANVVQFVAANKAFFTEVKPSFFEMTVAMAFWHFAATEVDVAVVEVGLGGRLDSTNIITPELAVITNIGLDHTEFLGETIAEIAAEKAGIIKPNIPVIIGSTQPETQAIFEQIAQKVGTSLTYADQILQIPYAMYNAQGQQVLKVEGEATFENLTLDLAGQYQKSNIKTVLATILALQKRSFVISNTAIYNGLSKVVANTGLMGRWQLLGYNPRVVCDTGHNQAGITEIVAQIDQTAFRKLHVVFGMVSDKNPDKVLGQMPTEATYYFTKASIPRSLNADKLTQTAATYGLCGYTYQTVPEAYRAALDNADSRDMVFVGGSTFVVADLLVYLQNS